MVNFPTRIPDCDFHSPALLDLFMFYSSFLSIGKSDHVVSVSIDFPSNSKRDSLLHCTDYDYSPADWDSLSDHLRDVPWEDIYKLGASKAATEFCEWV